MPNHKCPYKGCKYSTPHAHRMEEHRRKTKHGDEKKAAKFVQVSAGKKSFWKKVK